MTQAPYNPLHAPAKSVSQERMAEVLARHAKPNTEEARVPKSAGPEPAAPGNVPRASKVMSHSGSTTTGAVNVDMQMRPAIERWAKVLRGMPPCLYAALAEDASIEFTATEEGQLQKLCRRVLEAGQDYEETLRGLWKSDFTNASSRLQQALVRSVALSRMPFEGPSPNGLMQLEWLDPLPSSRGYYDTGKRYSVANVTIAGRVYWECWKLMPKASWFTVLACMLPSEEKAREACQKDSQTRIA